MSFGAFRGVGAAEVGGKYPWPKPGFRGVVRLGKHVYKARTQKRGDKAAIVELEIVTNTTTTPQVDPVGCKRTWYQKMNVEQTALGALKGYVLGALGIEDSDIEAKAKLCMEFEEPDGNGGTRKTSHLEKILEAAFGAQQSLTGKLVMLECVDIQVGTPPHPFTLFNWSPAPKAQQAVQQAA